MVPIRTHCRFVFVVGVTPFAYLRFCTGAVFFWRHDLVPGCFFFWKRTLQMEFKKKKKLKEPEPRTRNCEYTQSTPFERNSCRLFLFYIYIYIHTYTYTYIVSRSLRTIYRFATNRVGAGSSLRGARKTGQQCHETTSERRCHGGLGNHGQKIFAGGGCQRRRRRRRTNNTILG